MSSQKNCWNWNRWGLLKVVLSIRDGPAGVRPPSLVLNDRAASSAVCATAVVALDALG
jgi:hypothetical protein